MMFYLPEKLKKNILSLKSDFITVNLEGQIDVPNIFNSLLAYLNPHFPLLGGFSNYLQDFEFELILKHVFFVGIIVAKIKFWARFRFYGSFRNRCKGLKALESPGFSLGKYSFNNLNLNALIGEKDWVLNLLGDNFNYITELL